MKRFISVGLCALLSISPLYMLASDTNIAAKEARDAKINNILTGVGKVIEGLVKIITEIKTKDRHDKQNVSSHIKEIASVLVNDIAASLPQTELNQEDIDNLRAMLNEAQETLQPVLSDYLATRCLDMHIALHNTQPAELEAARQLDDQATAQPVIDPQEGTEKEFYTNLIGALHNLVQNLFTIIESPENPKVMGQSIADMFGNIINVASQTLKYEYLSSGDADEKVAIYLDTFSNELTKEIKNLMLQTALNLRDEAHRKQCCGSSCNSCCNSCSRICRPSCNSCSSCCRALEDASQDEATRSCCSSCSCSSTGSCSSCGGCCRKQEIDTIVDQAAMRSVTKSADFEQRHNKSRRYRACCSSCGCTTGNCGCRASAQDQATEADATKCGCNKPKTSEPTRAEQEADATKCGCNKPKTSEPVRVEQSKRSASTKDTVPQERQKRFRRR